MESNEETETPQFATTVRGYDRLQVDDYVGHLNRWIEQADSRAEQSETIAAEAALEVEHMRGSPSSAFPDPLTSTPESMKALGDQVGAIMRSSFDAAKELYDRVGEDARTTVAAAEVQAGRIIAEATARAVELSRAAEDLLVRAHEKLAGASPEPSPVPQSNHRKAASSAR